MKNSSFTGGSVGKDYACNVGERVWSLGWVDPLKKEMVIHSNILAWRIPWVGLLCRHKESDMTEQLTLLFSCTFTHSNICIDRCIDVYLFMHWDLFMYLGMYPSTDIYIYVNISLYLITISLYIFVWIFFFWFKNNLVYTSQCISFSPHVFFSFS